jgi:hypothetical protein
MPPDRVQEGTVERQRKIGRTCFISPAVRRGRRLASVSGDGQTQWLGGGSLNSLPGVTRNYRFQFADFVDSG